MLRRDDSTASSTKVLDKVNPVAVPVKGCSSSRAADVEDEVVTPAEIGLNTAGGVTTAVTLKLDTPDGDDAEKDEFAVGDSATVVDEIDDCKVADILLDDVVAKVVGGVFDDVTPTSDVLLKLTVVAVEPVML